MSNASLDFMTTIAAIFAMFIVGGLVVVIIGAITD
jgi:hypothetical protein